jgi:DNA-binding transcriptional MerR regulator
LFETKEVVSLTQIRRPMLDYLCRSGIVVPATPGGRGRGRKRMYSFGDIVFLKVITRLLQAGVSVKRMKDSFAGMNRKFREMGETSRIPGILVTDGKSIYFRDRDKKLVDLMSGQQCFAFLVELNPIRKEVIKQAKLLKSA